MGAQQFMQYQAGTDLGPAFRLAVHQAQYDYGHAGYTGTLAEKSEVKLAQTTPVTKEEAYRLAQTPEYDDKFGDKWGPAGAIPVCDDKGVHIGYLFFGWASS